MWIFLTEPNQIIQQHVSLETSNIVCLTCKSVCEQLSQIILHSLQFWQHEFDFELIGFALESFKLFWFDWERSMWCETNIKLQLRA